MTRPSRVRRIDFHRTKYGRELLVDAAYLRDLAGFDVADVPHALAFHDVLLVTHGRGTLELDGDTHVVRPGFLAFSRPGDVRRFRVEGLDGACLFFASGFVEESFSDPRFLDRFAFFRRDRPSGGLTLSPADRRAFLARFDVMRAELATLGEDAPHVLRAVLYDLLVRLNRWYVKSLPVTHEPSTRPDETVDRFLSLVDRDFTRVHRVGPYARTLGVSAGHLGELCRDRVRSSPGAVIRRRIALEARRLLLYTPTSIVHVSEQLGFQDPAYFARFFRRETGSSPSDYRRTDSRRTDSRRTRSTP